MKIIQFTAENIKKLKVVNIKPDGNLVEITGANGQGKSSVLDAIFFCLAGTAGIPTQPVRKGTEKAYVKLDLGEVTVTRRFVEGGGTSLIVEGEKGARFPSPQKMLDDLLGTLTFDPLAFTRMDAKKQLETLRSLVKLEIDIDELDRENKSDFDRRAEVNRNVKSLTARRDGILVQQGLPEKPIDIDALVNEMSGASTHNSEIEKQKNLRIKIAEDIAETKVQAESHRTEAARLIKLAEQMDTAAENRQKELDAMPETPAPIDTKELAQKISDARVVNAAITIREQRSQIQSDLNDAERESKELTEAMEARTKKRTEAIAAAKMPLETLSFGDGQVSYNGLPFEQASDAEQLRVSVAIAMAANPQLRVLRIKDGSLLDEKSLAIIAEMANKSDYQIWIERVDTSGKVGIVMEDGEVAAVNGNPTQAAAATAADTKSSKTKENKKK